MSNNTTTTTAHKSDSSSSPLSSLFSNSSSGSKKGTMSQCPYAVALSEDEASHSFDSPPSLDSKPRKSLLTAELSQCPAFNNGMTMAAPTTTTSSSSQDASTKKCPFQNAKSPKEVQQTLAQIPKSHYDRSSFVQVLRHFHDVHEQGADHGFFDDKIALVDGKCPMQPYIIANVDDVSTKKSFGQAMEDCSLAAIMARLAADFENHNGDDDSRRSGDAERHSDEAVATDEQPDRPLEVNDNNNNNNNNNNNHDEQEEHQEKRNSLAEALKKGTAVSHQAAEDVHFVRNFIRGQIDRQLYQELILSLYHVYVALEAALDEHAPTAFSSCHFPEALSRREALEDDVEFWHGTRTPSVRTTSPATQDYIDRIQYLSDHDPLLLLAHSYTRYLGDLSGGRILARVARRALDLDKDSGEGLAFYRFDKVQSYKDFKDHYRRALDALPLTSRQIQALVAEANVAFCLNMRLFQELDVMATIPGSHVMPMEQVMAYAHQEEFNDGAQHPATASSTTLEEEEQQCPFLVRKKQQDTATGPTTTTTSTKHAEGARCPWPFVFAHDPWQGLKDWQTWLLVAIIVAWFMSK